MSTLEPRDTGLVHLYTGDGKGKTTAAIGLAVRVLGSGRHVLFCQFLKGRDTCELKPLATLGAGIRRAKCGTKFMHQMTEDERAQLALDHCSCFDAAVEEILSGQVDLAVLDEVVDAVGCGLLGLEQLLRLLQSRPAHVELVLTGRNPPPALQEAADYHTDFVCRKHPYQRGVCARRGIEY